MSEWKQGQLFKAKVYCIDASSIINLFYHHGLPYPPYSRDIFEGLWTKLEDMIKKREIISHITVLKEIEKKHDEVNKWCHAHRRIFKNIDDCQIKKIKEIEEVYNKIHCKSHWETEIKRKGNEWADPWIIALAICKGAIIISDEKNSPCRIPYIANYFGIKTLNLMDFFKDIGLKLK